MSMLKRIKAALFRYGGLFWLWRFANRKRLVIFMLHGVVDESRAAALWRPMRPAYSAGDFDKALRLLSRYYRFVSLEEALDILSGRAAWIPYAAVVTFDDGYRNQFDYALPALKRHGVPATFYVATRYIDEREPFWFDRLDFVLQRADVAGRRFALAGKDVLFSAQDRRSLARSYRELRRAARAISDDAVMSRELDTIAATLERESGAALESIMEGDDYSALATWEGLGSASACELVDIGSHTVSHARLGCVGVERATRELTESRERIRAALGTPCRHFCYPSGSYSNVTPALVAQAGYASAVTSDVGLNEPGADVYRLRRLPFPDFYNEGQFLAAASGFDYFLVPLKSRLRRWLGRATSPDRG